MSIFSRAKALLVALFVASTTLVFVGSAAQAGTTPAVAAASTPSLANATTEVRALHNKARKAKKVRQLSSQSCLQSAALAHAKRQAAQKRMFHQSLKPLLKKCKLRMVGENVAVGQRTSQAVHTAWMNSPGHKKNILQKKYNRVGIAVVRDSNGRPYWAAVFGQTR